jgi:hypothetical protein
VLDIRRVAEGEHRVNELMRPSGARIAVNSQVQPMDHTLWASEVRYWRGYADALYFAMTIVDKTVLGEKPEPKEDGDGRNPAAR